LDDVRNAALALGVETRNPADVIYRMRSRTILPQQILDAGFHVLRPTGRGQYAFEKAATTIFEPPNQILTPYFCKLTQERPGGAAKKVIE
jgi:hypothetical protein